MQRKKKCTNCGGVYSATIPNSFFEREEHLVMNCPYCGFLLSMMIEDGRIIAESEVRSYLKRLPKKQVLTRPWIELKK